MKYVINSVDNWEPVTLSEARDHLNIIPDADDTHPDDDLIAGLIKMAREQVEHDTSKCLVKSTWYSYLNSWPGSEIIIGKTPVSAINSVHYIAPNSNDYTEWASENYDVDLYSRPARLRPKSNVSWPTLNNVYNAVRITFTAGYENAAAVPYMDKAAIKLKLAHLYANRQEVVTGTTSTMVNGTYNDIIEKITLNRFG